VSAWQQPLSTQTTKRKEHTMPQAVFPATVVQQRLWLLQQLTPESPVDNIAVPLRLSGPLQVAVLEQSLNTVIRRHAALRTTFAMVEGQLMQCIAPGECVTLPVVALSELPAEQQEAAAQRLVTTEARQPFDLATGPLLCATLFRLAAAEHILLLTAHRIICDEESMRLLLQDVAALYSALSTGTPLALPALPMQYSDFALWQRQWLQDEACVEQLSYWQQRLRAQPPFLQLPTDRPRPAMHTYRGATQSLLIPAALCEALHALSRQEGVTLFMVLLAAFQTLLQRYSSQEDISVGVPTTGRHCGGTEGLIGCFANTLVLRADLAGDPTFRELLQRVRAVVLEANAHQDMPFETLLEALDPEQDFSHTPLVQAMFQLQQSPQQRLLFSNLQVEHVACDTGTTKCDITLRVMEHTAGLWCIWEYNTALFDTATVARMAGHFQTLLTGIVSAPEQTISTLPLLTEVERYQLLVEWNKTPLLPTHGALRHEQFAAQAERTPDAIAVVCAGETLTYRELHERATQLAHYLQALGVGPEVLVGLFMERSIALVVGLLGILQAGGACVPLEPAYPPERLASMLEDAQLPVIVAQEHLLPQLPQAPQHINVVCLERDWQRIARESTAPVVSGVTHGNLTMVFYTSGSTAQPKAVMWPHIRDTGAQARTQATDRLTVADRHLLKSPIGFTLFAREIFWPLLSGAQVFIVPPGREQDSPYLVQLMAEQQITVINVVPSMLRMLLEEPGIDACQSLTQVICFGEALSAELQERLCSRLRADLSVYYGVTEAPSATSWSRKHGDTHHIVNIGRRLPNKQVFVLDAHLQPVPIGVPGEMYIGGNLARGYFKQPELTAEKFLPNPFSTTPGARMYKTGDLARYLPDGSIEFFGRTDQQVKIRGIRIELGEIEAVLCQHPAVREAVVAVWEQESGASAVPGQTDKRLVAYVVPGQEHTPRLHELRRYLKQKLPQYMVPAIFILLEDVPRNPNGKVDRQALPAPAQRRFEREDPCIAPRTPIEKMLADVWAEVLGLEEVGVQDNFFDLGGHSLFATRVLTRVRDIFAVELPLRTLFETPTLEDLAMVITQSQANKVAHTDMVRLLAEVEALSETDAQAPQ
jgi:amino acid adenylation domain-containing protein